MTDEEIARWISDRRCRYRKGTLSKKDVLQAESIPYWTWDTVPDFIPFECARRVVHSLHLKSQKEFRAYCKHNKPSGIPSDPSSIYKGQFKGMGDWLGTGVPSRLHKREWMSYIEARNYVKTIGIKNHSEWKKFCMSNKRPANLPRHPSKTYPEWKGYWHFFGVEDKTFLSYNEARDFARSLNLKTLRDWQVYCKSGNKPANIPQDFRCAYKECTGTGDWLGTGRVSNRDKTFLPFDAARLKVRSLGIRSSKEWLVFKLRPNNIPRFPDRKYPEFRGWADWLGDSYLGHRQLRPRRGSDGKEN